MKKIFFIILMLSSFIGFSQVNTNSTYVNGYYKSNGTYVKGYHRTKSNSTINDNYSTKPNINPYTGKKGTISPTYNTYKPKTYKVKTYKPKTYKYKY